VAALPLTEAEAARGRAVPQRAYANWPFGTLETALLPASRRAVPRGFAPPDHDHQVSDELRFVLLTPPGSACSIALTSGAHQMAPGSIEGCRW